MSMSGNTLPSATYQVFDGVTPNASVAPLTDASPVAKGNVCTKYTGRSASIGWSDITLVENPVTPEPTPSEAEFASTVMRDDGGITLVAVAVPPPSMP